MDILELLNDELKDKDWTIIEKARYLYIRSCELFTYDARYDFYNLFPDVLSRKEKIFNRKLDLRKVEDNRIVCSTYTKEVYGKMLRELLGVDSDIMNHGHVCLKFHNGEYWMKADSTISFDISRVKMNLSTYGYIPIFKDCTWEEKLRAMDQKIGYIEELYENEKAFQNKELVQEIKEKEKTSLLQKVTSFFQNTQEQPKQTDEFLLNSWKEIQERLKKYDVSEFTDVEYAVSYLEHKLIGKASSFNSNTVSLFQILGDKTWNYINIYPVDLSTDTVYYMLEEKRGEISFEEISRADALYYNDSMDGNNKKLIR